MGGEELEGGTSGGQVARQVIEVVE